MPEALLPSPLTSAIACDWLRAMLNDGAGEDVEMDSIMDQVVSGQWASQEEMLAFFKEVSIQLAQTACSDPNTETASLFDHPIYYGLSIGSPYYRLWEKAFLTRSPALHESISTEGWDVDFDSDISEIDLICLIPLATAYELPLFEQLRNNIIDEIDEPQEEFLGYVAGMLGLGYYDGTLPVEILNIPSSRIIAEILEEWTQYRDLWLPDIIESFLKSEYADDVCKQQIARVLRGEDDIDPEGWEEHREEYWEEGQIENILAMCS
jgi:hypothetical protein